MKLLILGGTQFIGRHLTEAALTAGHEVTLFNRGRCGTEFPVETLVGDRYGDVSALAGRTWDAVIDVSAYTPGAVTQTTKMLQAAVEHYTFVSTISVYQDFARLGTDENAPVGTITDEAAAAAESTYAATGTVDGDLYGPLKARCERVVTTNFSGRALVVRPGLVVGPYDYTDRLTYWVRRIGLAGKKLGTQVLAPGHPEQQVQLIDARDLAAWLLQVTQDKLTGTFNATGPEYTLTFGEMLETCRATLNPDAELVWAEDEFLLAHGLEAGELMPWHPVAAMPGWRGFYGINVQKALQHGLSFRPLARTVQDTFAWDQTHGDAPLKAGLTEEREKVLLEDYAKL